MLPIVQSEKSFKLVISMGLQGEQYTSCLWIFENPSNDKKMHIRKQKKKKINFLFSFCLSCQYCFFSNNSINIFCFLPVGRIEKQLKTVCPCFMLQAMVSWVVSRVFRESKGSKLIFLRIRFLFLLIVHVNFQLLIFHFEKSMRLLGIVQ